MVLEVDRAKRACCAEEAVGARISFVTSPQAPAPLSGASRRSVVSSCVCVCVGVEKNKTECVATC